MPESFSRPATPAIFKAMNMRFMGGRRLGAGEWAIKGIGISSLKYHIAIIFISYFKSQIIFQISGQTQRALLHG